MAVRLAEAEELPGEPVLMKTVNSAFIGTDLRGMLERVGGSVVCVGLTTDHWSAQQTHDSALASLHDEFARIVSTDELLR